MRSSFFLLLSIFILNQSCQAQKNTDPKAASIIQQSIEAHGGRNYRNFDISFDFRAFQVRLKHQGGKFRYERSTRDTSGKVIVDVLSNTGLSRSIDGQAQTPEDKYRESVNALAYFVLLPYKLNEPAVNLKHVGEIQIGDQKYDKIEVSFDQEGGGKDFQDVYCYWINQQTHTMDYLSYATGGPRFRKATRRETVGGIVFQDYDNYEIKDTTISTRDYDRVFMEGKAVLLSKIEQSNFKVH